LKVKINYTCIQTRTHARTQMHTHTKGILGTSLHKIDTLATLPTFLDKSEICNECFYLKTDELVYTNILEKLITYLMK